MTECYLARCQQDRKLARREYNKWTKNLLLQIGLETISKHHLDIDVHAAAADDEPMPVDFNPNQGCLFCLNRQEYIGSKKRMHRVNEHHHPMVERLLNDDENAPLDLSLKATPSTHATSSHRNNVKHRPFFDIKSDIPPMYNQDEFDRLMSDMIAGQMDFASQPFLNLNLFSTGSPPQSQSSKRKSSSSQDARIAQLAKQMAYERMMQEIDYPRPPSAKKPKTSINPASILTESFHVNHILNDVMSRILHDMFEKHHHPVAAAQPRASRKGELLFVKKQNVNNDEQYNANIFNNTNNHNHTHPTSKPSKPTTQGNPSSSSSSSTSSASSTCSSSMPTKTRHKSKASPSTKYIPRARSGDIMGNNNSKIIIGTDGKQIRPKRGQYRRYESEQLAKAVAAVLSNEMSVHKAGSYFGVPHSTLEYKVKERNIKVSSSIKPKQESSSVNENNTQQQFPILLDDEKTLPPSNSTAIAPSDDDDGDEFEEPTDAYSPIKFSMN